MNLYDQLISIREKLQAGSFTNEASISQGAILPILFQLGWDIFDTTAVSPEYPVGKGRVDYALISPQKGICALIEVKRPGKIVSAEKQLFEYAFHEGIPFVVLSDGIEWHFYLPAEQGSYSERQVYKLDILERKIEVSVKYLNRYLEHGSVIKGDAFNAAKSDYSDKFRDSQVAKTLPLAWKKLHDDQDTLVDILSSEVEDMCGFKPTFDQCAEYLSNLKTGELSQKAEIAPTVVKTKQTVKLDESLQGNLHNLNFLSQNNLTGSKPSQLVIEDESFSVHNWASLSISVVEYLHTHAYLKESDLPVLNAAGTNKYFVNTKKVHADPSKNAEWRSSGPFFVDIKYNANNHIRNIQSLLKHIGAEKLNIKVAVS